MIIFNSEFIASLVALRNGETDFALLDFTTGFVAKGSATFRREDEEGVAEIVRELGPGPKMQCSYCDDIIQSMFRHDFVKCRCGKSFVDGGGVYLRMGGSLEPVKGETK